MREILREFGTRLRRSENVFSTSRGLTRFHPSLNADLEMSNHISIVSAYPSTALLCFPPLRTDEVRASQLSELFRKSSFAGLVPLALSAIDRLPSSRPLPHTFGSTPILIATSPFFSNRQSSIALSHSDRCGEGKAVVCRVLPSSGVLA